MHNCETCGMYCDCDGEDHDQSAPRDCRHECESEDIDIDPSHDSDEGMGRDPPCEALAEADLRPIAEKIAEFTRLECERLLALCSPQAQEHAAKIFAARKKVTPREPGHDVVHDLALATILKARAAKGAR